MRSLYTRKLVAASLFAALVCIFTSIIIIPLPNGFANLGDCFCILAGGLLGPVFGPLAAAIGSALADLLLGYGIYAPATFVIKGLVALVAALLFRYLPLPLVVRAPLSSICAGCVTVVGYLGYEWLLYGAAALATVPGNSIQAGIGAAAATILLTIFGRHPALTKWL